MISRRYKYFVACAGLLCALPFASLNAHALPNLALPTFGGQEFWTDYAIRDGARVQCHAITHHCRLLDADNVRRDWGSRLAVTADFNALFPARRATIAPRPAVVLVHGLFGNDGTFTSLKKTLIADDVLVFEFSYASALTPFDAQASALHDYVASLSNVSRITFVTHSMGGLVVDQMMAREKNSPDMPPVAGIVRLGSPMAGSALAQQIASHVGPDVISRTPLAEVAHGFPETSVYSISQCNVAGSLNDGQGVNPFVPGDDDGIVAVSETSRDEETRPVVVVASHYTLTSNPAAIRIVRNFLRNGKCSAD